MGEEGGADSDLPSTTTGPRGVCLFVCLFVCFVLFCFSLHSPFTDPYNTKQKSPHTKERVKKIHSVKAKRCLFLLASIENALTGSTDVSSPPPFGFQIKHQLLTPTLSDREIRSIDLLLQQIGRQATLCVRISSWGRFMEFFCFVFTVGCRRLLCH